MQESTERKFFTIFRTADDKKKWVNEELRAGRLRQGWGVDGLSLKTRDGEPVDKNEWEKAYRERTNWGNPSLKRFTTLRRMLELKDGDIVVIPKMPWWGKFTVARVNGPYRFEMPDGKDDFGHIVPVDTDSIREFVSRANDKAMRVQALFRGYRYPVSSCWYDKQVEDIRALLKMPSNTKEKTQQELLESGLSDAFKAAAEAYAKTVEGWEPKRFEDAVRQRFIDRGYTPIPRRRFDGKGADQDVLMKPPSRLFQPREIAVQVKWKQGIDDNDVEGVKQIHKWAEKYGDSPAKYVISSASRFTDEAQKEAEDKDVELIGGLQAMCFLLGIEDRYREEWDAPKETP